jgi:hypothetical protein
MAKGIKYGSKEYHTMIERMHHKAKKPFKIEEFCAQVAWMRKDCPVYPDSGNEIAGGPCEYLTSEEYDGYRCPVATSLENFVPVIVEEGTEEQKKALEYLADMYVLFSQRRDLYPHDHGSQVVLLAQISSLLNEAQEIYKQLGLEDKAKTCDETWRLIESEFTVNSRA